MLTLKGWLYNVGQIYLYYLEFKTYISALTGVRNYNLVILKYTFHGNFGCFVVSQVGKSIRF